MQRLAGELAEHGLALEWSPVDLTLLTGWRRGAELDADLARELGIDAGPEVVASGRDELTRRTRHAGERGVAGVPSCLFGEWPIAGIQCDATMLSMLSRFAARQRKAVS
jgi:predicted DsbA family dithiol-disulfide isomerase